MRCIDWLGDQEIYRTCDHRPNSMYFLPKLMWYRDNQLALYSNIWRILLVHSYIVCRLSGKDVTDLSMAARMMMLDVCGREWSNPLLEAARIPAELLPPAVGDRQSGWYSSAGYRSRTRSPDGSKACDRLSRSDGGFDWNGDYAARHSGQWQRRSGMHYPGFQDHLGAFGSL